MSDYLRVINLLVRADEILRMIPPPLSDCYTNGLQADIHAEIERFKEDVIHSAGRKFLQGRDHEAKA